MGGVEGRRKMAGKSPAIEVSTPVWEIWIADLKKDKYPDPAEGWETLTNHRDVERARRRLRVAQRVHQRARAVAPRLVAVEVEVRERRVRLERVREHHRRVAGGHHHREGDGSLGVPELFCMMIIEYIWFLRGLC